MKYILLSCTFLLTLLVSGYNTKAQDFVMAQDTVYFTTVSTSVPDDVINNSPDSIKIKWQVISSDFPSDWLTSSAFGLCDNSVCYGNGTPVLWNGTSGVAINDNEKYAPDSGNFDYQPNLATASPGTHYFTVKFTDLTGSRNATFIITRPVQTGIKSVNTTTDALIYPNPATSELNITYDADADIKNIAVYNIIGKVMNVYKTTAAASANLDLSNLPSGIYFARLVNSYGEVVVTKKFTKQ